VDQIGRYRILDELGRGATGVVYRAQDPAIGRTIAIKTIRLSDFTDESERERLRERLFREAQSAGMLSHPNIVTIYDIAEENGLAYIFMDCVDGPPLEKVLNTQDPPLRGDAALTILRQTATGLDYAHKKGIVHRDIKPANILIHERTHAKITDFGVAKIMSQQMTQSGVMMGTPNYMSPEQVQGHAVDGRADQFSLAVIAYEILTGEKPFLADQLPALLFRIVREDPVAPQRLNPTVGPQVESVLRKALAKSANDRYGTCMEFVDALAAALQSSPGWHPLPRSSAHSMPTMAGPAVEVPGPRPSAGKPMAPAVAARVEQPVSLPREAPPRAIHPYEVRDEEASAGSPLLKSLVWMLVGIGLVGLVLFGAQKYLFNRNAEPAPAASGETQPSNAQTGTQTNGTADNSTSKPSPVGQQSQAPPSQAGDDATKPASASSGKPPEATAPESQKPDTSTAATDDEPKSVTRQLERATPAHAAPERTAVAPPVTTPKLGIEQSVQFLTEPPGAQVVIDGNSAQACKTPCIMQLSAGRHALTVQLAGYRPYPRVFNVPQEGDIFLQLTKVSATLSVTSEPRGATIELDGALQTQRTPATFTLAPGTYHIKVARSGAFIDFDVQLRDGEFINKRVDF
jgi:serine/threonine protein kinase